MKYTIEFDDKTDLKIMTAFFEFLMKERIKDIAGFADGLKEIENGD